MPTSFAKTPQISLVHRYWWSVLLLFKVESLSLTHTDTLTHALLRHKHTQLHTHTYPHTCPNTLEKFWSFPVQKLFSFINAEPKRIKTRIFQTINNLFCFQEVPVPWKSLICQWWVINFKQDQTFFLSGNWLAQL